MSPLTTLRTLVGAAARAATYPGLRVQVSLWRRLVAWKRAGPAEADGGGVDGAMLVRKILIGEMVFELSIKFVNLRYEEVYEGIHHRHGCDEFMRRRRGLR